MLSKFGNLSIREILVVTSVYVRPPARTDSGGGGGESQDYPTGWRMSSFLGGKSRAAFGQPAVFLGGKLHDLTVAFEKEVFLKA